MGKKKETAGGSGYLFWALVAIELFMSFSFLGYIHIEPISLTFVYIPVLAAGCVLGAREAACVGAVFGLASMWKASAFYVTQADAMFSPVMSGKPLESVILSVGTRVLFGFLVGFLYQAAEKGKHPLAGVIVVSSFGRTLHTSLVYGCMGLLFPESGFGITNTLQDMRRWDFLPFILIMDVMISLCYLFCRSDFLQRLLYRVRLLKQASSAGVHNRRNTRILAFLLVLVLLSSFSVALYFTNRIGRVMSGHGIELSPEASYDVMHLQIQFLLGMIALALMVIIVIILYQKNFNYLYYKARLDGLTGLLGRNQFFQAGENLLDSMKWDEPGKTGCFILLDVDHFKSINDQYGHPEGDRLLKEVAKSIQAVFGNRGIIGRLGGDEFVVLVHDQLTREEVEGLLNVLKDRLGKIRIQDERITCSVGVIPTEPEYTIDELYRGADRLLYEAKKKGKDQFAFGYRFQDREMEKKSGTEDGPE